MSTLKQQESEIEKLINELKFDKARKKLSAYISQHGTSVASRLFAARMFYSIPDFSAALKAFGMELATNSNGDSLTESERDAKVLGARLLNMLGASQYALNLVDQLPVEHRHSLRGDIGGVLLMNMRFSEALELFCDVEGKETSSMSTEDFSFLTAAAVCRQYLGDLELAQQNFDKLIRYNQDPRVAVVAYKSYGIYFLEQNEVPLARVNLEKSLALLDPQNTLQVGSIQTWLAACDCLLGNHEASMQALQICSEKCEQPGVHPDFWLNIWYWKGLNQFKRTKLFPVEWARLLSYPTSHTRAVDRICAFVKPPYTSFLSSSGFVSIEGPTHYDLHSRVKSWGPAGGRKHKIGLDLPDQLHALLILSGSTGIPQFRIYQALWPDEPFAFFQHQKRLEQVVMRLRDQGTEVLWDHLHLRLRPTDQNTCYWESNAPIPGHSFLRLHSEFSRAQVEAYFSISRSRAAQICQAWEQDGHVQKSKNFKFVSF